MAEYIFKNYPDDSEIIESFIIKGTPRIVKTSSSNSLVIHRDERLSKNTHDPSGLKYCEDYCAIINLEYKPFIIFSDNGDITVCKFESREK